MALAGSQEAAEVLRDKLSGSGSGRKYPGLPNRSSTPGEYPAEQTSDLVNSIDARVESSGKALFGPIRSPPVEAGYLHFSSEEDMALLHFRPPDMGGRPFLDDARHDRDIHRAIVEGIEQEARAQFGQATVRRTTSRHDRDIHRAIVEGIEQEARAQFGQATVRRTT
ncbi:hypothetical protein CTI14_27160 [Methylobacterium radiotolerans]|nr:hypothetical protein CTI14_27160 [Methylobacterium radiotolerans]